MSDALQKFKREATFEQLHDKAPWHPFCIGGTWAIRLYPYRAAEKFAQKYSADELKLKRDECFPHNFMWVLYNTALNIKEGVRAA